MIRYSPSQSVPRNHAVSLDYDTIIRIWGFGGKYRDDHHSCEAWSLIFLHFVLVSVVLLGDYGGRAGICADQ